MPRPVHSDTRTHTCRGLCLQGCTPSVHTSSSIAPVKPKLSVLLSLFLLPFSPKFIFNSTFNTLPNPHPCVPLPCQVQLGHPFTAQLHGLKNPEHIMRTLRVRVAQAGQRRCHDIPGESSSRAAAALTQQEGGYVSWNSFPNLNSEEKQSRRSTIAHQLASRLGCREPALP